MCLSLSGHWEYLNPAPSRLPFLHLSALEKIDSSCAKALCCHRHSAPRGFGGIYRLKAIIPEPWIGQKAAAHEGWLHTAFLGFFFPQAWPEQEHKVLLTQLHEERSEPAVQAWSYIIYSRVFLTHAQKYEEILFFKRIFCISISCFIQDLQGLHIQSLSAIPVTLMLTEKLVTKLRRMHPGDLTPPALFLNLQITFSLKTNK